MKIFFIIFFLIFQENLAKAKKVGIYSEDKTSFNSFHIKTCNAWGENYDDTPEKKPDLITSSIYLPLQLTFSLLGEPLESVGSTKTNFYNSYVPPGKDKIVILKNLRFGNNKDNIAKVYSIRKYESSNGSELIKLTKGLTHSNKYFIVNNGINRISYEIVNDKNKLVLDSGEFTLYITYTNEC